MVSYRNWTLEFEYLETLNKSVFLTRILGFHSALLVTSNLYLSPRYHTTDMRGNERKHAGHEGRYLLKLFRFSASTQP
jgi:hypothetical protein